MEELYGTMGCRDYLQDLYMAAKTKPKTPDYYGWKSAKVDFKALTQFLGVVFESEKVAAKIGNIQNLLWAWEKVYGWGLNELHRTPETRYHVLELDTQWYQMPWTVNLLTLMCRIGYHYDTAWTLPEFFEKVVANTFKDIPEYADAYYVKEGMPRLLKAVGGALPKQTYEEYIGKGTHGGTGVQSYIW